MKKYIASFLMLCAVFSVASQSRIDKEIERMEKMPYVETLYTEKRAPKNKKLLVTSRIFNFTNMALYQQLSRAFEAERQNSVSAMKTKSQITYRFEDNKGVSTYTLTKGQDGQCMLIMKWVSSENTDPDEMSLNTYSSFESALKDLAQFDVENGDHYTYYNFKKGTLVVNDDTDTCNSFGCPYSTEDCNSVSEQIASDVKTSMATVNYSYARAATEASEQAAEARKAAAKARKEALAKAAEARKVATKARKEALAKAAEARKQAAKARKEAAKARAKASRNNIETYRDGDNETVIIYQL